MHFIDVSAYQGVIDWKKVRSFGIIAAYLKATEGMHWNDQQYQSNRAAAAKAGIHVGAYHFASAYDGVLEAKHFLKVIGSIGPKDLKPVLDFEVNPRGQSPSYLRNYAYNFNTTVHQRTGVWPMFYSYASFIEGLQIGRPYGNGLWIAAYGRNDGVEHPVYAPAPWKKYVAHQFTSRGKFPGIAGNVDISDSPNGLTPLLAHPVKDKVTFWGDHYYVDNV